MIIISSRENEKANITVTRNRLLGTQIKRVA